MAVMIFPSTTTGSKTTSPPFSLMMINSVEAMAFLPFKTPALARLMGTHRVFPTDV